MSRPVSPELVRELCRRVLAGRGELEDPGPDVAAALRECRRRGEDGPVTRVESRVASLRASPEPGAALAEAVARELWTANAALPGRQREALALRELLGLSHDELAQAIGIDVAAVGALLARARLALRSELRGVLDDSGYACRERERALRALARRQDREPLAPEEAEWIRGHIAACPACERAHAAMLEASVCYRGWDPRR